MTGLPRRDAPVEIEAKFFGGSSEFERIVAWLRDQQGLPCEILPVTHRIHFYFDEDSRLRTAGCRLRCVIASGEWYRYDFKADDPSGETLEISIKKDAPGPLPEMIDELAARTPEGEDRRRLRAVRDSARMILALTGRHRKAMLRNAALELEVSWDVLTSIEKGTSISEIEVELVSGQRADFENCIALMVTRLNLQRGHASKLEQFLKSPDPEKAM